MNKILIVTTDGCKACFIAKRNVEIAKIETSIDVEIQVEDWHNIKKDFIKEQKIEDFPTVFYMIDDKVIDKTVGTYPSVIYLRWINTYFKN